MEPSEQRITDQERQQVAEVLRHAAGEGRIDFDELEKRLDGELQRVPVEDQGSAAAQLAGRTGDRARSWAVSTSSADRDGLSRRASRPWGSAARFWPHLPRA
jgi:hypothetical protein